MGLKQDICIKNEFSLNTGKNHGSRGGTPGQFVMRYMARSEAVENIAPTIVHEFDDMLLRYDKEEDIADNASSIPEMQEDFPKTRKKGGLAFTHDNPAMSDQAVRNMSKDMQEHFNNDGCTALKLVFSFDTDYLKKNGVLSDDFEHEKKGDYAGCVDELKLRMAVMNGMDKLAARFDDLQYTGVVHVNGGAVHCHVLAMDYGKGRTGPDGRQKGKLSAEDMNVFRHGVDMYLDEKQTVKQMTSSVSHDRQSAVCYVKRFTHKTLDHQGFPQFLLACLPKDRNLWSANTNRREMQKANAVAREFVVNMLQPSSGKTVPAYRRAHQDVIDYANERQRREGLSETERMKLVRNGEEKIITDCINGMYSVLKDVPEEQMNLRTSYLEEMSMDYDSMAAEAVDDPSMEFGFKLRSYSSRLSTHRDNYHRFRDEYKRWEETEDKTAEAQALADHLALERDYQQMLMVKYQYFLTFLPDDDELEDEYEEVMEEEEYYENMLEAEQDRSLKRMNPENADRYGRETYGIGHTEQINTLPAVWERRRDAEREKLNNMVDTFRMHLQDYGMDFDGEKMTSQKPYSFDDVKALDLHHLGYDFPYDARISKVNVDKFIDMADRRYESFENACDYLRSTGQESEIEALLPDDVLSMKNLADRLSHEEAVLVSSRPEDVLEHDGSTISLDMNYEDDLENAVINTVRTEEFYANEDVPEIMAPGQA